MSPQQLRAWDDTKNTLERPIEQLRRIPAADPPSLASRADGWLAAHNVLRGNPVERMRDLISPPTIDTRPMPAPEAPSVALGYANKSRLVR
jgi:hypothetical protein